MRRPDVNKSIFVERHDMRPLQSLDEVCLYLRRRVGPDFEFQPCTNSIQRDENIRNASRELIIEFENYRVLQCRVLLERSQ